MKSPSQVRRVLMVTGAYHPEISSGGLQCQNIARSLKGRVGVDVLTTSVDRTLPLYDTIDDVPVTRIPVDVSSGLSKIRAGVRMVREVTRLVRRADLVHLHGCSTKNVIVTLIAKLFRRPVVLSLHTAGYDEPEAVERQGSLALWAFMSADEYLSVSPVLIDAYLKSGMPADRIQLVPNGIDVERFAPPADQAAVRAALNLPQGRPLIVFVGFFSEDKQPHVLFEAWQRLHLAGIETTLVYVGATASTYFEVKKGLADRIRDMAATLGVEDRVVFTGETHDVASYLKAADVFVLPSRREGLPVALLEAMATALPCIASRLAGSTDTIVEDGRNGLLIPPGEAAAFSAALERVLGDGELSARLGRAARDTVVERFSSGDVADRWLAAYDRVRRPAPAPTTH